MTHSLLFCILVGFLTTLLLFGALALGVCGLFYAMRSLYRWLDRKYGDTVATFGILIALFFGVFWVLFTLSCKGVIK